MEWDDEFERRPEAVAELIKGHERVERWLRHRARLTVLRLKVLTDFHRVMFGGVFPDLAGRLRGPSPQFVHRNVSFGVYAGTPADQVPGECYELAQRLEQFVRQLDALRDRSGEVDLAGEVLKVASYAHCELIRIHPFVNENGRVARTTINYFAWRYGFLPVPFEQPRAEYLDAIRAWLRYRKIEPFVEFLRPAWERRPEEH